MRGLLSKVLQRWHRRGRRMQNRPSLVQALGQLVPRKVLREVFLASNDRRQWGVLAAAWVGVSEREFTQAVAEELRLEFEQRVPVPDLTVFGERAREILKSLRAAAVVPVLQGQHVTRFIVVDPAEVRAHELFSEGQALSIGQWSDIAKALESAEHRLGEAEALTDKASIQRRNDLTQEVLEAIVREAAGHGSQSVELILDVERAERPRYQFTTRDNRHGVGYMRREIAQPLRIFIERFQGSHYLSPQRGRISVRCDGIDAAIVLAWGGHPVERGREDGPLETEIPSPAEGERAVTFTEVRAEGGDRTPAPFDRTPAPQTGAAELQSDVKASRRGLERAGVTKFRAPVLIVDDNPMFGRVIFQMLEREGFEPYHVLHGEAAWERLSTTQADLPHAIICDLHMPLMNGQELLQRVKSDVRLRAIPFVVLTSDDDVSAEVGLLARGADAYVLKSKDPRILCAQVRRLVDLSSSQEAA